MSSPTACGDNLVVLVDDLSLLDEKLSKLDTFVNEDEFAREECVFVNEILDHDHLNLTSAEFKSLTNSTYDIKQDSFIDNLTIHLLNEDCCMCDLIVQNDKFISVPLGNLVFFYF